MFGCQNTVIILLLNAFEQSVILSVSYVICRPVYATIWELCFLHEHLLIDAIYRKMMLESENSPLFMIYIKIF